MGYALNRGVGDLAAPGGFICSLPNWMLTSGQATACVVGVNPVAVPPAPTQAQLDAVAASADPGAAAAALVQQLSNQAVTQTQANTQAAVDATPDNPYLTINPPANPTLPSFSIPSWVWIGLGVVGGILVLKAAR